MAINSSENYVSLKIKKNCEKQEDKSCGDINQNFVNQRNAVLHNQQHFQQLRGINSMKASPDSGWTFPNMIDSQLLKQNFSSQQEASTSSNITSKNRALDLHLPLVNHYENGGYNPGIFQDAYQTKLVSPLVQMNLRQRQLQQQQQHFQQIQRNCSQSFSNVLTPNSGHPYQQQYNQHTNIPNFGGMRSNGKIQDKAPDGIGGNKLSSNNRAVESRTCEQPLPAFDNFSSSIPIVGSPQFQAAIAAAQMKTYYSFLQNSTPSPNTVGIVFGTHNKNIEHNPEKQTPQSGFPHISNNNTSSIFNNKKAQTFPIKPHRPTLLGHLKSMDAARNKTSGPPYGYEGRHFQPTISASSKSSTNTASIYIPPIVETREGKINPTRPNHFGTNLIPQTLLSVNVTNTSDSPGQNSPYSVASLQSNSPAGSDKGQGGAHDFNSNNVCPQCSKQFSSSSALAKHKLTHSDERKFVCHICSRGFKRQDHLNGHMITHRDKKPHECHFQDCGKSYCDMRSLRRHLENHHSSPPGGTTPASYMPKLMLYPGYSEDGVKNERGILPHNSPNNNRLDVSDEPPRPSSAPLVPPEPKRITRTRRSSSGEETHMQLDPSMLREIEHLKKSNPYARRDREASDDYIKPRDERFAVKVGLLPHLSAASAHLLKTSAQTTHYEQSKHSLYEHDQRMDERHRQLIEYEKHLTAVRDAGKPSVSDRLKEYEGKHDYGLPGSYPPGLPPRISSAYPWASHQSAPTRPSPASGTMPYLLNIRNPFNLSPHGAYGSPSSEAASSDLSKLSKSEIEARHQAVSTYYQMWANGQHNLTPEQLYMHSQGRMISAHRANLPSTPTDPISIAVAAAKEPNDRHSFHIRDGLYGIHPTNAKWQPVMQDDSVTLEKEKKPNFYHHNGPPGATSHDSYAKRLVTEERNIIDEPFKPSESNHKYSTNNNRYYDNRTSSHLDVKVRDYGMTRDDRHAELSRTHSPQRFETPTRESRARFEHPHLRVDTPDGLSSSALSPNKKRPRPGPIIIPPAVNNRSLASSISPSKSFPGFPRGIYTPPAMLSPRSIFFNPPGFGPRVSIPPHTPQRMHLTKRRSSSIDQREVTSQAPLPPSQEEHPTNNNNNTTTTISGSPEVPEPKINIGAEFQAALPHVLNRTEAQKDTHRASLMWCPLKEDQQKYDEVVAYLDMACSLVLYGGSNNKEYALHILQRTRGNVKEAVRLLLSRRHILRADDPNADYHYSGSVRWTAKERLAFRQAYRTKGKVFIDIQKEVCTKGVQQCVEFYYLWKAMHPESFRARTRMVEVESEQDDEEVPPTPTAAVAPLSTLREPVFECDYPDCRARFVSRQALNGHIRVHGGSFSKPVDTRRPKGKPETSYNPIDGMPSPPKKKKTTQPDSVIMSSTGEGPMPQFQCKVCGRVFSKVKSRSAHMKTHVKRDENNKPIKTPKPSKQKTTHQRPPQHQQPPQPPTQPPQQHPPINPMTVFAHA